MTPTTSLTALLVMDMQDGILGSIPNSSFLTGNTATAIAKARSSNIPVIYVIIGFRAGTPEISTRNKGLTAAMQRFANIDMAAFMKIHTAIAPQEGDIIVIKRSVSAFTGSDLEVVLRSLGIQHLVLTGIATSGVVLSTLREAADKDYRITVLSDCCFDADEEVHWVLTTKVFPRQADVVSLAEWIQ